jgi:hypothetical protein
MRRHLRAGHRGLDRAMVATGQIVLKGRDFECERQGSRSADRGANHLQRSMCIGSHCVHLYPVSHRVAWCERHFRDGLPQTADQSEPSLAPPARRSLRVRQRGAVFDDYAKYSSANRRGITQGELLSGPASPVQKK